VFGNRGGRVHPIRITRVVNGDTGGYSETLDELAHRRRNKRQDLEDSSDESSTGLLAHVRYH
jgi:hypothetical protein